MLQVAHALHMMFIGRGFHIDTWFFFSLASFGNPASSFNLFFTSVKILFHSFAEFKAGEGDVNNIIILTSKLMKFIKDH